MERQQRLAALNVAAEIKIAHAITATSRGNGAEPFGLFGPAPIKIVAAAGDAEDRTFGRLRRISLMRAISRER